MWHIDSSLKFALGIIGNVAALGLFLAPIPTMVRIMRERSTADFSSLPYTLSLLNCILWSFYGTPIVGDGRILVLTVNGFGVFSEAVYLIIFLLFAPPRLKARTSVQAGMVLVCCGAIILMTVGIFHGSGSRSRFVGIIADVVTIGMYASPLGVMRLVIKTKSVEFMPFFLSLNSLACSVSWFAYGLYTRDIYVGAPNGIGVLLGAGQLVLYAMYYKGSSGIDRQLKGSESKADLIGKDSSFARGGADSQALDEECPKVLTLVKTT